MIKMIVYARYAILVFIANTVLYSTLPFKLFGQNITLVLYEAINFVLYQTGLPRARDVSTHKRV